MAGVMVVIRRLFRAVRICTFLFLAAVVALVAIALQIKEGDALRPGAGFDVPKSMKSMNVLITGASSGIGFRTASLMCKLKAKMVVTGPDYGRLHFALQEIEDDNNNACNISMVVARFENYPEVHYLAHQTVDRLGTVNMLVLNAGTHYGGPVDSSPAGKFQRQRLLSHSDSSFLTKHNLDRVMTVNHYSHFLLTKLLMPNLAPDARIVIVAGNGMWDGDWRRVITPWRIPWEKMRLRAGGAYCDSKMANVCFGRALRKRVPESVTVVVTDPGYSETGLTLTRGGRFYEQRRFGIFAPSIQFWQCPLHVFQAGEKLLQAAFATRPVPDVIYNYWLPPLVMKRVQDMKLVSKGDLTRSKIVAYFLALQSITEGPLYAGVGPGCGNDYFLDYFWNQSLARTGFTNETDQAAMTEFRTKYLKDTLPVELAVLQAAKGRAAARRERAS